MSRWASEGTRDLPDSNWGDQDGGEGVCCPAAGISLRGKQEYFLEKMGEGSGLPARVKKTNLRIGPTACYLPLPWSWGAEGPMVLCPTLQIPTCSQILESPGLALLLC